MGVILPWDVETNSPSKFRCVGRRCGGSNHTSGNCIIFFTESMRRHGTNSILTPMKKEKTDFDDDPTKSVVDIQNVLTKGNFGKKRLISILKMEGEEDEVARKIDGILGQREQLEDENTEEKKKEEIMKSFLSVLKKEWQDNEEVRKVDGVLGQGEQLEDKSTGETKIIATLAAVPEKSKDNDVDTEKVVKCSLGNLSTTVQCNRCHRMPSLRVIVKETLTGFWKVALKSFLSEWSKQSPLCYLLTSTKKPTITNKSTTTYSSSAVIRLSIDEKLSELRLVAAHLSQLRDLCEIDVRQKNCFTEVSETPKLHFNVLGCTGEGRNDVLRSSYIEKIQTTNVGCRGSGCISEKILQIISEELKTMACFTTLHYGDYHEVRYKDMLENKTLDNFAIFFKPTRVKQYPKGDCLSATQIFTNTNCSNDTHNSLAKLHVLALVGMQLALDEDELTHISKIRMESEILLHLSQGVPFSGVLTTSHHMETNKKAERRCKEWYPILKIWKCVQTSGGTEATDFKINCSIEITRNIQGSEIPSEVNVVFSSTQHQEEEEEEYAHIHRDEGHEQILKGAVVSLKYKKDWFEKEESDPTGEKSTRPNSPGTKVKDIRKDTEKSEEPAKKQEERIFGNAKADRKRIWWMSYVTSCAKQLQSLLLFCWIIGFMTLAVSASFSCPETQTAELGKQGFIVCSFPDSFHAVYWYGDVGDGSAPLVTNTHITEEKSEFCLENEDYDVFKNGTLLICNVAVWHERNFTVILYTTQYFYEEFTVSVKVIASPGNRSTTVQCDSCHEGYYQSVHARETLSCSFNVARPPVQIEWVERYPHDDSLTVTQNLTITENRNGTYNSSANLNLANRGDKKLAVFVCEATFLLTNWRRENEILLDFSHSESFSSVPSNTFYMETNKRAEIKCEGSNHTLQIWKIVPTAGEPETIGFKIKNVIKMTKNITGIEISPVGNLIFSSPQLWHEGDYACVYSDGVNDQIQKTTVVLLIPPSPPYIKMTGCDDTENICLLDEAFIQELACTVDGVYPNATLEWVSKNPSQISFYNSSTVYEENGQVYDVSASVNYRVSADVLCEDDIHIECRLEGPISRIVKAERVAKLKPVNCSARRVDNDDGLTMESPGWKNYAVLLFVIAIICNTCLSLICLFIYHLMFRGRSATAKDRSRDDLYQENTNEQLNQMQPLNSQLLYPEVRLTRTDSGVSSSK